MVKKDGKEIKSGVVIFITVSLFLIVFGILGIIAKVWKALRRLR
jgi:F0F1-type ATP synthase assembly protein I